MNPLLLSEGALLVVDAQQGFTALCPRELPIPGGLDIVPAINRLLDQSWARIDASQDWHPANHRSFLGNADNLYPPHCVAGTQGAEFLPGLRSLRFHAIWRKGYDPEFEAYAVTAQHPGFPAALKASGVNAIVICGLATNICCFYAAKDLRSAGFRVCIVEDASAGIDVPVASLFQSRAKAEGQRLGIEYVTLTDTVKAIETR
jgi:nicotinamidase/pyrazinamidase